MEPVVFTNGGEVYESDGSGAFIRDGIRLGGTATQDVTVVLRVVTQLDGTAQDAGRLVLGEDYIEEMVTVVIPMGESSVDVPFPILNDSVHDGDKRAMLEIVSADGADVHSIGEYYENLIVYDDDAPTVSVESITFDKTAVVEGNPNPSQTYNKFTATVTLDAPATALTSVLVGGIGTGGQSSANGEDVGLPSNWSIWIKPGETTGFHDFNIRPDYLPEGNETFRVYFGEGYGTIPGQDFDQFTKILTIIDDDLVIAEPAEPETPDIPIIDNSPTKLIGTPQSDVLYGNGQDQSLYGFGGDDTLDGGGGNDILSGGDGYDTAIFSNSKESFRLEQSGDTIIVVDRSGADGTDTLFDIEAIQFTASSNSGSNFMLDIPSLLNARSLSVEDMKDLVNLYIAYFDRAPDAFGLNFWADAYANGTTLKDAATAFMSQVETREAYPSDTTNEEFADIVYQNVLGRTADADGYEFWVSALNSGGVSRDQFILAVLEGTQAQTQSGASAGFTAQQLLDQDYLSNKVNLGMYFALEKGLSDIESASLMMELYTGSEDSIEAAINFANENYDDANTGAEGELIMPIIGFFDNSGFV